MSQPLLPSPVQASYEPASSNNSVPGSQQSALLSSPPPAAGERMQSGDRRHNQQAHVEGRPSPHSGKRPQPSGQSKGPRADRGRTSTGGVPQQTTTPTHAPAATTPGTSAQNSKDNHWDLHDRRVPGGEGRRGSAPSGSGTARRNGKPRSSSPSRTPQQKPQVWRKTRNSRENGGAEDAS